MQTCNKLKLKENLFLSLFEKIIKNKTFLVSHAADLNMYTGQNTCNMTLLYNNYVFQYD